jgi:hypothetical protein
MKTAGERRAATARRENMMIDFGVVMFDCCYAKVVRSV